MKLSAKKGGATLVVGTTPDYIEWIRNIAPGRCLFLTDSLLRQRAKEPRPGGKEEILCDLADYPRASARLAEHLERLGLALDGVACFDCESMELTAVLAERYPLPYPSRASIYLCRNKYLSKLKWREKGLRCPRAGMVRSAGEAERFRAELDGPAVLKPLTGSGSEHVCLCRSAAECRTRYESILSELHDKRSHRLYRPSVSGAPADGLIVAEEYIDGEEYSCDFMIDGDHLELIRLTKKIPAQNRPFGTIHGYLLCDALPGGVSREAFRETIRKSAASIQIDRAICMLDFIVRNGEMVLLELAPRPGGDCLPHLLLKAQGLDILKLSLDFAGRRQTGPLVPLSDFAPGFMGIRIIAREGGILRKINIDALKNDPRVLEIGLSKEPGHEITLPPEDYDSWILGHVITRVAPGRNPVDTLIELDGKIHILMDKS